MPHESDTPTWTAPDLPLLSEAHDADSGVLAMGSETTDSGPSGPA